MIFQGWIIQKLASVQLMIEKQEGNRMMKEIDCCLNEFPVCPNCGNVDQDWWDGLEAEINDGSTWGASCGSCEADYTVTANVNTTFNTKKGWE
jgi:hypothetical protein